MNRHFSKTRIITRSSAVMPQDLESFDLDAHAEEAYPGETALDYMPLYMRYNDGEDWYRAYGEEKLYAHSIPRLDSPGDGTVTWATLHQFVTDFAWLEGKWRFILGSPCWMLHADVVDRVVMMYSARKNFEEHRATSGGKFQTDYLDVLNVLTSAIRELLNGCKLNSSKDSDTGERAVWIEHHQGRGVSNWISILLSRVITWEGIEQPPNPSMDVARNAELFSDTVVPNDNDENNPGSNV